MCQIGGFQLVPNAIYTILFLRAAARVNCKVWTNEGGGGGGGVIRIIDPTPFLQNTLRCAALHLAVS
jgi:hypothetical protein